LIHKKLKHPIIKEIRSSGLMMAVELTKRKYLKHVVSKAIENGVLIDYFLFNDRSFRLAPPLILEAKHIDEGVEKLMKAMDYAAAYYE
jgi:acetylornithine/succinyldiaminopimelate/putrescine aminotransferase